MSAGNVLELQMVIAGRKAASGWPDVEALLSKYKIVVRPFDEVRLALARDAALRFGKGRHKAGLNFGDCFAHALAQSEALALLCIGDDFAQTDVTLA